MTLIVIRSAISAGMRACSQLCSGQTKTMMKSASVSGANTDSACEAAADKATAAMSPTEVFSAASAVIGEGP